MGSVTVPFGLCLRLAGPLVAMWLLAGQPAVAFPASDAASPPLDVSIPPPSESDLQHQLQLHSGFGAPAAAGWTFVPRVSLDEIYTDNVLNTEFNRRWDLLTLFTPGITVQGNTPNAQVQLDYAPAFLLAARTPSENHITQQLAGTGLFTIVQDALYLDMRAFAGGAPINGAFGGLGTGIGQLPTVPVNGFNTTGLSQQNQVQTASLSVAPYWLHRFDDIGTAKVGYQFNQSSIAQGNSVVPLFFPTGSNALHSTTNEGIAQFETGERFAPFRNLVIADAEVTNGNGGTGNSQQYTFINRLGYLVRPEITVFGELGYENLHFGGVPPTNINDAIWGVGTTLTPNPDSRITASFGHRFGENAVQFDGSYALTARTRIAANYSTGIETDLQGLQGQLDLLSLDSTGRAVDSVTGAPLFIGTGGLGFQSGLFRSRRLSVSANTVLDRDQVSLMLQYSTSTTLAVAPPGTFIPFGIPAPPVGSNNEAKTAQLNWVHQFSEDLTMSSGVAYTTNRFPASNRISGFNSISGANRISGSGNEQSVAASVAVQYLLSQSLAANARYTYLNLISPTPGQSFYQNLVLIGLTKQF